MTYAEQILKMAYDNNGIVTSAQVTKTGILREHIRTLVKKLTEEVRPIWGRTFSHKNGIIYTNKVSKIKGLRGLC